MDLNLGIKTEEPRTFQVIMARNATAVTADGRAAVEAIKADGCDGWRCTSTSGRLVKRRNAAGVYLLGVQCDGCGKFYSRGVKRTDHPGWASYLDFDPNRRAGFSQEMRQEYESSRATQLAERRREYAHWLATSSEWQDIRIKVLERADFRCEACLENEATQVHHTTYAASVLPPAWLLKAVCGDCHERMHDDDDAWRVVRAQHA